MALFEDDGSSMPILHSVDNSETAGIFSLWMITANNSQESKVSYVAQFVSDTGRNFTAYANDLWASLVQNPNHFISIGSTAVPSDLLDKVQDNLYGQFCKMEESIVNNLQDKANNKLKANSYALRRVERIGIENIKKARRKRLEQERQEWLALFERNSNVVPGLKQILAVRIDG